MYTIVMTAAILRMFAKPLREVEISVTDNFLRRLSDPNHWSECLNLRL